MAVITGIYKEMQELYIQEIYVNEHVDTVKRAKQVENYEE